MATHSADGNFDQVIPLCAAPAGCPLIVRELRADSAACLRLREMGISESSWLRKLTNDGNLVCQVCGMRVALGRRLGALVLVEPLRRLGGAATAPEACPA